jgi:hypothetical protein
MADRSPTSTNGLSPNSNAASILTVVHAINSAPNNFVYDNSPSTDAAFWDVKFWSQTHAGHQPVQRHHSPVAGVEQLLRVR